MGNASSSPSTQRVEVKLTLEDRSSCCGYGGAGFSFDNEWGTGGDIHALLTQEEVRVEMDQVNAILHKHVPSNRYMYAGFGAIFMVVGFIIMIATAVGGSTDSSTTCRGSHCSTTYTGGPPEGIIAGLAVSIVAIAYLVFTTLYFQSKLTGAISEIRAHLANNVCPRFASRGVIFTVDSYTIWTSNGKNGNTRKTIWYVGVHRPISHDAMAVAVPMAGAAMPMQQSLMPMMMPGQQQQVGLQQPMMMQPVPGQYGYAYPGQQPLMQSGMPPQGQYYQQQQQYPYPQQQHQMGMLAGGQQGMVPGKAGWIAPAAVAGVAVGGAMAAGGAALPAWSSGYGANNGYRYDESSPAQMQQQMYQQDQQYRGFAHGGAATPGDHNGGGGGYGGHHHGGAADTGGDAGHSYGNDNCDPSAPAADGGDSGGGDGGGDGGGGGDD